MQGGKGAGWFGMPGGKFSLGRLEEGSGYCVGAVVETTMGVRGGGKAHGEGTASGAGELAGNGMRDMWVVGEGFFRGVGGVFDVCPAAQRSSCDDRRGCPAATYIILTTIIV